MLHDDFQRNTAFQHCFEKLQHCSKIVTLCYAKNRRCESSPVTSFRFEDKDDYEDEIWLKHFLRLLKK